MDCNETLEKKIDSAITLLQSIPADKDPIEICYSGGKDSDVILELAKMAGIKYRAIYKNTTIDPPGTIKHCRDKGVEIFAPKISFFELVKKKGCPTRRARFCCEYLKEYKVLDRAIQGIRRCESVKRAKNYHEPEICRIYSKNNVSQIYLPILDWTNTDIAQFITMNDIKCHPLYYDDLGSFHVDRRLGCIGCPLKSDRGKNDYKKYPKMLKQLIKNTQIWLDSPHPRSTSEKTFGNAYNLIFHNLFFCDYDKYKLAVTGGIFPENAINAKTFLEEFFEIDLTI